MPTLSRRAGLGRALPALPVGAFVVAPAQAQVPIDPGSVSPPVVVTASRLEQDPFAAPRAIDLLTSQYLQRGNFKSTPQALRELPSVMVQETAPGQGSPFVRGFTGYLNLLLIDGIRLNNSAFRAGPNQYWSTVDLWSTDRIEVLRGVASTQYGSDAIGGTVQVFTKSATGFGAEGTRFGGGLFGRYATAEDSIGARGEVQAGIVRENGLHTGVLVGGSARSFGELEGGDDTGRQPNTDHDETGFDVKVEHWLDRGAKLVFLHQEFAQDNVPRTHATVAGESWRGTAVGADLQRDLDQNRRLTYLQYHRTDMTGPVQAMRASVSWHVQRELEDRITGAGAQRWQAFEVGTFGAFLQFESDLGALGRLTYGVDWYHDNVNSWFRRVGAPQPPDAIQGQVANDARYDLLGVFVEDQVAIARNVGLQLGARYTHAEVDAKSVRDPAGNRIAIADQWDEVVGNVHLRVGIVEGWNVYGGVSQGFRAPSLSDLSSFDIARSGEQEVPAPGLDAERYLGYEIGTKVRAGAVRGQLAWYYTDIDDQILRFPTGTTNADGQPIVTKANVGTGYVQGVELQYEWECLTRAWLYGSNTWQHGRVSNFNGASLERSEEYVSRLMPFTTQVGLRWEDAEGRFHAETWVVRAEDADKLSAGDQRDTQRIPPGGTPSYTTWNLRCGWRADDRTNIELAVENITDVDYRVHGSGSNAPGRNFVLGMRTQF
ncbi:MAG: TonB-dependent receptor [Planctomycetes bacterium]|nr:TonB-dependent receptor [Planctomycetota bacterium]